jgi:ATP-dependent Clp protease ATP-binding subunit ClpC
VHTPALTPVLGNFSRSTRGAKKNNAGHIPRATTLDCFTSRDLFQNAVALAQTAFRGSFGGEKGIGLITRASFDNLVQRVMGLLAVAEYQIWRLGWLVSSHKDILLSQLLQLMSLYLLEHIFREVKYTYIHMYLEIF